MKLLEGSAAAAVPVRPAATTLILRDGAAGIEVLMVRRSLQASFMPGAYVFPGGAVDTADAGALAHGDESDAALTDRIGAPCGVGARAAAYAVAALRECFEECGLWLGADIAEPAAQTAQASLAAIRARLHRGESLADLTAQARHAGLRLSTSALQPWAHWITPLGLPKRFDTLFFVCRAPAAQQPSVDAGETTTLAWVQPRAALRDHAGGGFQMEFATVRTVQSLLPFADATVAALLAHAAALRSLPVLQPRIRRDAAGRVLGPVLQGEPGWDEAS